MNQEELLHLIKEVRLKKGCTQAVIAEELSISESAYRKMENGGTPLYMDRFLVICRILKIQAPEIIGELLLSEREQSIFYENKRLKKEFDHLRSENHFLREIIDRLTRPANYSHGQSDLMDAAHITSK